MGTFTFSSITWLHFCITNKCSNLLNVKLILSNKRKDASKQSSYVLWLIFLIFFTSSPKHHPRSVFLFFSQFSSVAQSCPTLCDPMDRSTPGLPVHHQLQDFTQTHIHRVSDAIQPSHPLSSPSPPAPNPAQHQSLFQ